MFAVCTGKALRSPCFLDIVTHHTYKCDLAFRHWWRKLPFLPLSPGVCQPSLYEATGGRVCYFNAWVWWPRQAEENRLASRVAPGKTAYVARRTARSKEITEQLKEPKRKASSPYLRPLRRDIDLIFIHIWKILLFLLVLWPKFILIFGIDVFLVYDFVCVSWHDKNSKALGDLRIRIGTPIHNLRRTWSHKYQ